MKKLITIVLFCWTVNSIAQVPGYMGKRLVVSYSFNFSGAFLNPTAFHSTDFTGSSDGTPSIQGINTTHGLNIDYIYKNRKAVSFIVQYARTGVDYFYPGSGYYYDGDPSKPAILNSLGIGLASKFFKRANFAPYGPYVKWEAMMFMNQVKYNKNGYYNENPNTHEKTRVSAGSGVVTFQTFGLGLSFGKQRIWKDKFVIDRGVRFMIIPSGYLELINNGNYSFRSVQTGFESEGLQRIFGHQFISFHLGFGLLAF